jgi:hypothetical protein
MIHQEEIDFKSHGVILQCFAQKLCTLISNWIKIEIELCKCLCKI